MQVFFGYWIIDFGLHVKGRWARESKTKWASSSKQKCGRCVLVVTVSSIRMLRIKNKGRELWWFRSAHYLLSLACILPWATTVCGWRRTASKIVRGFWYQVSQLNFQVELSYFPKESYEWQLLQYDPERITAPCNNPTRHVQQQVTVYPVALVFVLCRNTWKYISIELQVWELWLDWNII